VLATATMNREGLAVKQTSSAGHGSGSDGDWQSRRTAKAVQRAAESKQPQRRSSMGELLQNIISFLHALWQH